MTGLFCFVTQNHFLVVFFNFLQRQQKQSLTLDIITGFHLIDGNIHLMVLEGLQDGAMQRLLNEVDLSKKKGK